MKTTFVLSVGGSILASEGVNTLFLKKFTALIKTRVAKGDRFILITGGGGPARAYQEGLKKVAKPTNAELDEMGIAATRLNAQLLRLALGAIANTAIVTDPTAKKIVFTKPVLISGGSKPGWSTDYVSVNLAKRFGAHTILNLSNIDYVYTKDPRKHADAEKITLIDWKSFQNMVGTKWEPGANVPFDPIATSFARKNGQKVIILNGNNVPNLEQALNNSGRFKGTVIA